MFGVSAGNVLRFGAGTSGQTNLQLHCDAAARTQCLRTAQETTGTETEQNLRHQVHDTGTFKYCWI